MSSPVVLNHCWSPIKAPPGSFFALNIISIGSRTPPKTDCNVAADSTDFSNPSKPPMAEESSPTDIPILPIAPAARAAFLTVRFANLSESLMSSDIA